MMPRHCLLLALSAILAGQAAPARAADRLLDEFRAARDRYIAATISHVDASGTLTEEYNFKKKSSQQYSIKYLRNGPLAMVRTLELDPKAGGPRGSGEIVYLERLGERFKLRGHGDRFGIEYAGTDLGQIQNGLDKFEHGYLDAAFALHDFPFEAMLTSRDLRITSTTRVAAGADQFVKFDFDYVIPNEKRLRCTGSWTAWPDRGWVIRSFRIEHHSTDGLVIDGEVEYGPAEKGTPPVKRVSATYRVGAFDYSYRFDFDKFTTRDVDVRDFELGAFGLGGLKSVPGAPPLLRPSTLLLGGSGLALVAAVAFRFLSRRVGHA